MPLLLLSLEPETAALLVVGTILLLYPALLFLGFVIVMLIITILLSISIFNLLIKSFLLIERRFVCVYFTVNFNFNYGACKSD